MCKKLLLCIMCIVSMCLLGCDTDSTGEGDSVADTETQANNVIIYDKVADKEEDRVFYQNHTNNDAAVGNDGYYYVVNSQLHYYDTTIGVDKALCGRTTCSHGYGDTSCEAYVRSKDSANWATWIGDRKECMGNMVFYHNNGIYLIKSDETGDYLVKYDKEYCEMQSLWSITGSTKERFGGFNTEGAAVVYGDYLYYLTVISAGERTEEELKASNYSSYVNLNRIKLEASAKPEKLATFDISAQTTIGGTVLRVCGDYIYMFTGTSEVGHLLGGSGRGIYEYKVSRYNVKDGTFKVLDSRAGDAQDETYIKGVFFDVMFDENLCMDDKGNVYVIAKTNGYEYVYVMNFESGLRMEELYKASEGNAKIDSLYFDGTNLYVYEHYADHDKGYNRILQLDKTGKQTAVMEVEYDHSYMKKWNGSSWNEKKARNLPIDLKIVGGDSDRIIVRTKNAGVKGLTHDNTDIEIKGKDIEDGVDTYAVGVINKRTFGQQGAGISRIYQIHE